MPYHGYTDDSFDLQDVSPALPETFSIRVVANGFEGPVKRYPDDKGTIIWQYGDEVLNFDTSTEYPNRITFTLKSDFTLSSFDCYINEEKVNIIYEP